MRERETRREINRDGDRHVGHDEEEFSLNFSLVKPNAVQICTFSDGTEKAASLSLFAWSASLLAIGPSVELMYTMPIAKSSHETPE